MAGLFRFRLGLANPPVNSPPVWTSVADRTVAYGGATSGVSVFVSDPENNAITYSVVNNTAGEDPVTWPSYLELNASTGVITALVAAPVGQTKVAVRATDVNGAGADSQPFNVIVVKGTNRNPVWANISPFTVVGNSTIPLAPYVSDLDGASDIVSFTSPPGQPLPTSFSLDSGTGALTCPAPSSTTAYTIWIRATDLSGGFADKSFTVTVTGTASTGLTLTLNKFAVVNVQRGYGIFWNKAQIDKRDGMIQWSDGAHGDNQDDQNDVRYYNAGTTTYTSNDGDSVPPGGVARIEPYGITFAANPSPGSDPMVPPYCKVSQYDNYAWAYVPSEDKWFWINQTGIGGTGLAGGGGRYGIFDMQEGTWTHGNLGSNYYHWEPTNGPYWWDYVKPTTTTSIGMAITKNPPNDFSEFLEKWVMIGQERVIIMERNPNYTSGVTYSGNDVATNEPQPWRLRSLQPSASTTPWIIGFGLPRDGEHNQLMNSGVFIGEWLYFIRKGTLAQKATYPDPNNEEFYRVRFVPQLRPTDAQQYQFQKLAHFPRLHPLFDTWPPPAYPVGPITGNSSISASQEPNWGPLLVYDTVSNGIFALYNRVYYYSISNNTWTDVTPTGWERWLYAVGGMIKKGQSIREIIFTGGNNIDRASNNTVNGVPHARHIHHLVISGGEAKRARYVQAVLDKNYPFGANTLGVIGGKHRRFYYSYYHKLTTDTDTSAPRTGGYVYVFGGDYNGVPFTGTATPTNYPTSNSGSWGDSDSGRNDQWRIAVAENSSGQAVVDMSSNQISYYPYQPGVTNTDASVFGPGHLDGCCVAQDKFANFWLWGTVRAPRPTTPQHSDPNAQPFLVYRWRQPGLHTDGIRLGNAWHIPPQNVLWSSSITPSTPNFLSANSFWVSGFRKKEFVVGRRFNTTCTSGTVRCRVVSNTFNESTNRTTVVVALEAGSLDSGLSAIQYNVDDITSGNSMDTAYFGGTNSWGTYDPKENCLLFLSRGDQHNMAIFKFPLTPDANGRHVWTRTSIPRAGGATAFYNFLNPQIRSIPGTSTTPYSASSTPTLHHGSHVIWNDQLYVTAQVGGGSGGYGNRKLAYIQRVNLRDYTDQEYIAWPYAQGGHWCRGHDAQIVLEPEFPTSDPNLGELDRQPTSINEFRDMQNLGHLLVFSVPANNYSTDDPFIWMYDTTRNTWAAGQTYKQMRVAEPTLPLHPNMTGSSSVAGMYFTLKGRNVAVAETGEFWTTTMGGNGIIKYRVV